MPGIRVLSVGLVAVLAQSTPAAATTILYTDRLLFETAVPNRLVDDYSDPAYGAGDVGDTANTDVHTDARMSSIVGETDYTSTGATDINIIARQLVDPHYCAGCNGSFELGFTTTSIGTATGVLGVGFDFFNSGILPYHAFVTFGDGSTEDIALPLAGTGQVVSAFFGILSDAEIRTIHLGLEGGGSTTAGTGIFGIDNLTIGVPEPSSATLLAMGLLGLAARPARRRARRRTAATGSGVE